MEVQGFGVPPSDSHTTWALGACTVFRVPDCALHLPLGAAVGPPTLPQATVLAPLGRVCRGAPRSPSGRRGLSPGSAAPRGLALCWWELGPPEVAHAPCQGGAPRRGGLIQPTTRVPLSCRSGASRWGGTTAGSGRRGHRPGPRAATQIEVDRWGWPGPWGAGGAAPGAARLGGHASAPRSPPDQHLGATRGLPPSDAARRAPTA